MVELHNVKVFPLAFSSQSGSVRGGIVGPGLPEYVHQRRGTGTGLIQLTTRLRHTDPSGMLKSREFKHVEGVSFYVGPLHRHFGHCLTESFSRIWALGRKEVNPDRFVILPEARSEEERNRFKEEGAWGWQKDALDYVGLYQPMFVTEPTIFERLVVPEQASILFSDFHHPEHVEYLDRIRRSTFGESSAARKIFYSRGSGFGSVAGEKYLGTFLEENGYETITPEELSFAEQLSIARESKNCLWSAGVSVSYLQHFR